MLVTNCSAAQTDGDRPTRLDRLLARVAEGDVTAFEDFFVVTWSAVRERAYALVRDSALADEVAQEVMLEVWRSAARFDITRGSAAAWLMTMTRRRAIDRVRHEQSARRRDDGWAGAPASDDGSDVADVVILRLRDQQVRRALASLTDKQAEAVALAFFSELTYREVALALGIPLPTAKSRIRDGLRGLVRALDSQALTVAS